MNRHLHNTLSALSASGALLVLGLIAAAPLASPDADPSRQGLVAKAPALHHGRVVASATEASAVSLIASAIDQAASHNMDAASPNTARGTQRQRRQTLVMPYLSFLPRG